MGYVLDIILIVIIAVCVIYGAKKGFFKSLASLVSGIAALLVSYTFTPRLSGYLKDTFVLDKIAGSLYKTFASIAEAGEDAAGAAVYDLTKLFKDSQFTDITKRAGLEGEALMDTVTVGDEAAVESLAYAVAEPLTKAVCEITSFIIIFVVSLILLRIVTAVIGLVFKLPVLKSIDKTMGTVFGALGALFFVWVFAMSADSLAQALSAVAPSSFGTEMIENSLLLKFFAEYNPIGALTDLLATKA